MVQIDEDARLGRGFAHDSQSYSETAAHIHASGACTFLRVARTHMCCCTHEKTHLRKKKHGTFQIVLVALSNLQQQ